MLHCLCCTCISVVIFSVPKLWVLFFSSNPPGLHFIVKIILKVVSSYNTLLLILSLLNFANAWLCLVFVLIGESTSVPCISSSLLTYILNHTGDSSSPSIQGSQSEGGWVWMFSGLNCKSAAFCPSISRPFLVFIHVLMRSGCRSTHIDRPGAWWVQGKCEAWLRRRVGNWGSPLVAEAAVEDLKDNEDMLILLSHPNMSYPQKWKQSMRELRGRQRGTRWVVGDIHGCKFMVVEWVFWEQWHRYCMSCYIC